MTTVDFPLVNCFHSYFRSFQIGSCSYPSALTGLLTSDSSEMCLCRSKDFGSPNSRERCYIMGVRQDICDHERLEEAAAFVKFQCPRVHKRVSLLDCCPPATVAGRVVLSLK